MASKKIQVGFPLGGVDQTGPRGLQTPGTTRWARNVRGVDHRTGRSTGAQRAPLRAHAVEDTTAPGKRTQGMALVAYDNDRNLYTQLNNILNPDVSPTDVVKGHLKSSGASDASLSSIETDTHGNLYAMGEDRLIHKFSPDGELLHTLPVLGHEEEEFVRRIQVDAAGNIYAISASSFSSTMYRFEPHEDLGYTTRYRFKLDFEISDFVLKFNMMYVAAKNDSGASFSSVRIYYGLDSGTGPWEIFQRSVPHPVHGIAVSPAGELLVTCPYNPERNASPDGGNFYSSVVDWTPHEIGYETTGEYQGYKRIHAWHDAKTMVEDSLYADGDRVYVWPDRKQNGTASSSATVSGQFTEVADTTIRPAYGIDKPQIRSIAYWSGIYNIEYGWRLPPTYNAGSAWGGMATLSFSPAASFTGIDTGVGTAPWWNDGDQVPIGNALYWRGNTNFINRSSDTATLPAARKLTPGTDSVGYTTFIVARINPGSVPTGLFCSTGHGPLENRPTDVNTLGYGIVCNLGGGYYTENDAGGTTVDAPPFGPNDPGSLMLVGQEAGGVSCIDQGEYYGEESKGLNDVKVYPRRFKGEDLPDTNTVIIAIHHDGELQTTVKSAWRVNGKHIDAFRFRATRQSGAPLDQSDDEPTNESLDMGSDGIDLADGGQLGDFLSGVDAIGSASVFASPNIFATERSMDYWTEFIDDQFLYRFNSDITTSTGADAPNLNHGGRPDVLGFDGQVAEVITVLASEAVDGWPNERHDLNHILIPVGDTPDVSDPDTDPWWTKDGEETTTVEKIEGYLAYKWGIPHTLDPNHPYHPDRRGCPTSYTTTGGDGEDATVSNTGQGALNSVDPLLVKYDGQNGALKWAYTAPGVGLGVEVDADGNVYTMGQTVRDDAPEENKANPTTGANEQHATVRKTLDLGATFSCDEVGTRKAWTLTDQEVPESALGHPVPRVDANGDVYLPVVADTSKRLGGDGMYKVNGKDGSIDYIIPAPVNYFMEGADTGLAIEGESTGLGADDWSKLPWGYRGGEVRPEDYFQVLKDVSKHPLTGETTVVGLRGLGSPVVMDDFNETSPSIPSDLPKYKNLLYSAAAETSHAGTPSGDTIRMVDSFVEGAGAWEVSGTQPGLQGTTPRDSAYINTPHLVPPYSASGKTRQASLLSTSSAGHTQKVLGGSSINARLANDTTYCFSLWIRREPLDCTDGTVRTNNYARIDMYQQKGADKTRISYAVLNLDTGVVTGGFQADGGDAGGSYGSVSFTAAKDYNSTDTAVWDRVYVTMPYDTGYADEGVTCRVYPAVNSSGQVSPSGVAQKGAIHVWEPMLIQGTEPTPGATQQWPQGRPYGEGGVTVGWDGLVWVDGLKASERSGVYVGHRNADSPLPRALEVGDEVFFSYYIGKVAKDASGNLSGPTDYDPNPTSVNAVYDKGSPWTAIRFKDKDADSTVEQIVVRIDTETGNGYVQGSSTGPHGLNIITQGGDDAAAYNNAVVVDDAGDYWRVGVWMKYFGADGSGNTADFVEYGFDADGYTDNVIGRVGRLYPCWGAELFVNSGVHPNAPEGLIFPTPTASPHAPKVGGCRSVALPPKTVKLDEGAIDDTSEFTVDQEAPETVAITLGSNRILQDKTSLRKFRVVAATPQFDDDQTTRAQKLITVSDGSLYEVNKDNATVGYTLVEGSENILSQEAGQVRWASHQSKLYLVDGEKIVVYDPKEGTVGELESKKEGEVPKRPKIIASWRNRLVLARTIEEPHNWHMSAVGDAENWDYFPVLPVSTQAVSGNTARAGLAPDVVNALIPYNDDLMLIGGDRTISRMTGDPMAGGQIDLISQSIGIAFGDTWCMDPEGVVYFASTEGDIYAMPPMGQPQRISNSMVRRQYMDQWHGGLFRLKLVWNHADEGLHVFFMPGTVGYVEGSPAYDSALAMRGLFWERRHNAWWVDEFHEDVAPHAATNSNGDDPNDRALLVGTRDGKVLRWGSGENAADDNGQAIDSRVFIDLITPRMGIESEMKVTAVESRTYARTSNALLYVHAADDPHQVDEMAARSEAIELGAREGSERIPVRAKGKCIGLSIRAAAVDSDWTYDELFVTLTPAGRQRLL